MEFNSLSFGRGFSSIRAILSEIQARNERGWVNSDLWYGDRTIRTEGVNGWCHLQCLVTQVYMPIFVPLFMSPFISVGDEH